MTCYLDGCSRRVHAQGLCNLHYSRQRREYQSKGLWEPVQVDAEPFKKRIREFIDAGYNYHMLSALSGIERNTFARAISKDRKTVIVENLERLEALPITPLYLLWRKDIGVDYPVPQYLASRRVRALMAMGWSTPRIAQEAGTDRRTIQRIGHEEGPHQVKRSTLVNLDKAYDFLSVRTPPRRPRSAIRDYRWPLPLEWDEDEIDLPDGWKRAQARAMRRIRGKTSPKK